ncbi:gliding motility-associated C-terminal domain-containing protein [Flagellimonas sediminis]|uniref:T9SS type B sorting domain-containing protein n=1 Tax=Flagellimonas sediminis TaxID=2696468 RepID=A0A6I5L0B1_9FLAO|nr:gliding motility-associated C-terminal domain-containing protein [Allomuricauda sediminis]NDV42500.1 T9SS type B sorting domain-containing protein [Allomuricauda sediminis]
MRIKKNNQKSNSIIWYYFVLGICFISCSSDGPDNLRSTFKCCTENIDGNVKNLPLQENGEIADVMVTNVITPNGDGINDYWLIQNLYLYPNNKVEIYNSLDQLIFSQEGYESGGAYFPPDNIAQGSYRYKIVIENEETYLQQGYLCVVTEYTNYFKNNSGCVSLYLDPFLQ